MAPRTTKSSKAQGVKKEKSITTKQVKSQSETKQSSLALQGKERILTADGWRRMMAKQRKQTQQKVKK